MRGIGRIFEACSSGELEADDEVAVLHGPAEAGFAAVTEALVNIRATLAAAERVGLVPPALRASLAAIAKAIFYPERSWGAVLAAARTGGLPEEPLAALGRWLPANRVNQKRSDAIALIERLRDRAAVRLPHQPSLTFEVTEIWHRFVARQERSP
jgi:hypothetical protein